MPQGTNQLPGNKKEERDPISQVLRLAPLLAVILQLFELLLKVLGVIR